MQPISGLAMAIWIVISVVFDLLGIIPVVGDFAGPLLMISLTTYLWKKGYGFINTKRLAIAGIDMIFEMIPALQSIPINLIAGTTVILIMAKIQAKTGIPLTGKGGTSVKALNTNGIRQSEKVIREMERQASKIPANQGGTRMPQYINKIDDTDDTLAA